MVTYEDIFEAYYDCLRNKRKSAGALKYLVGFEEDLIRLTDEINQRRYAPSVSTAFRCHRAETTQLRKQILNDTMTAEAWAKVYVKGHYQSLHQRRTWRHRPLRREDYPQVYYARDFHY